MLNLKKYREIAWISYAFLGGLSAILSILYKGYPHPLISILLITSFVLWIFSLYPIVIIPILYLNSESKILTTFCIKNNIGNLFNLFINSREENIRIEECASREVARLEKFRNDYSLIALISVVCSCIAIASFYLTFNGSDLIPIPMINSKNWLSIVGDLLSLSAGLSALFIFLLSRQTPAERTYRRLVLRVREHLNHEDSIREGNRR